jgi:hypothetical protein
VKDYVDRKRRVAKQMMNEAKEATDAASMEEKNEMNEVRRCDATIYVVVG